ncbi:MAG: hypothetical protein V6Z78_04325 [Holosporaceae bacterium]
MKDAIKDNLFYKALEANRFWQGFFQSRPGMLAWGATALVAFVLLVWWATTVVFYEPNLEDLPVIGAPQGPLRVKPRVSGIEEPPLAVYRHIENPKAEVRATLQSAAEKPPAHYERHRAKATKPVTKTAMKAVRQGTKRKPPAKKITVRAAPKTPPKAVRKPTAKPKATQVVWRGKKQQVKDKKRLASVENLLERLEAVT